MEQIAGFRYRAESVLAKLRPAIVREARIEGLRKELLNSQKLQAHFAAKPSDLVALQHVHQAPLVAPRHGRGEQPNDDAARHQHRRGAEDAIEGM